MLEALRKAGLANDGAEVAMLPKNLVRLEGKQAQRRCCGSAEVLEEHDDVQNVYSNFDIDEKELAALAD